MIGEIEIERGVIRRCMRSVLDDELHNADVADNDFDDSYAMNDGGDLDDAIALRHVRHALRSAFNERGTSIR